MSEKPSNLKEIVYSALDSCKEQSYWNDPNGEFGPMKSWSDEDVAKDMIAYDCEMDYDDVEVKDLVPFIAEWRKEKDNRVLIQVTLQDGTTISRCYDNDDPIWKLEEEKRERKLMADTQRAITLMMDERVKTQVVTRG